jgi:RNA recognition motif-containing protein
MNIFISNLSFQAMDNDLKKLFSSWGEVKSARVVTDDFTRRSRGFAFVEITEEADAMKAIEKLNNTSFMQKTIIVRAAKAKEDNGTTKKPIL